MEQAIAWARTAVEESIDEWNSRLSTLVSTKRETYPKLAQRLSELFDEAESKLAEYALKSAQIPKKWESLPDLLSLYYCVNDDLASIKTKMIQALARLSTQEKQLELLEVAEALEEWQSADLIPRDKVKALVAKYESMLAEFRLDLNNRVGGMMLSPDLDLVSRPYKRWGFLRWLWLPYQKIPHRHWLSHGPVIGSGVRLLYLAVLVSPLWVLFPGLQQVQWSGVTLPNVAAFLIGVELSALNHLLLDGLLIPLPKSVKRRLKGD